MITPSLSETLNRQDHGVGTLGVVEHPVEHRRLFEHQVAGGVRQAFSHVSDARLLSVDHPETVGDVRIGQRGILVGEPPRSAASLDVSRGSNRTFSSSPTSPSASDATIALAESPVTSLAVATGLPRSSGQSNRHWSQTELLAGTPWAYPDGRPR